jgi:hypothetical protein
LDMWNVGKDRKALELFWQMQHGSGQPVPETFVGMLNACANIIALEEARCSHEQIIKAVVHLLPLWRIAWLTCMQNVGAWRMLEECSTNCHHVISSLGIPWYWYMWNVGKGRRPWNCFNKFNTKVCGQTLSLMWGW